MNPTDMLRRRVPRTVALGGAIAASLAAWAGASVVDATDDASAKHGGAKAQQARNIVLFIGDGMGQSQRDLIRVGTKGFEGELSMNLLPYAGLQHTEPKDPKAPITDSAASATAIATGVKTFNGAIGIDANRKPVRTVLEDAERRGKATGLVTTGQITDATPAAFGAHVENRSEQSEIGRQYLENARPEVLLGGGEDYWYPAGNPGAFPDQPADDPSERSRGNRGNLVDRAKELGYDYVTSEAQLRSSKSRRLLGLFANQEMFQQRQEGKGDEYDPRVALPTMTRKALDTLGKHRDGFFLMVEEEGIDEFAHNNNAPRTLESGRAFDSAVEVAREYQRKHPDTLVLVTADHETGGLALETTEAGDESGDGASREDGPYPIPGENKTFTVDWTTTGHTAVDVPLSAGGPAAGLFTGYYDNTAIADKIREAGRYGRR